MTIRGGATLAYARNSIEQRLLEDEPQALGQVVRWISVVLTAPRFWPLRAEWADLQQETLMRIISSLRQERFDPSRDFRAYAQGVARYTALQAFGRKRHDAFEIAGDDLPSPAAGPEERAIQHQLVRRIFEQISEPCRELVRLYFLDEQDYEEIAGRLSLPQGTIKSRLFRCLQAAHRSLHRKALSCERMASTE
jgi:RNA polymerase sigma-70 factor (ECF subfamily)